MSTYILVHGAWMDDSAWQKVIPLLERLGHTVIVRDLPGHGADATPPAELSLRRYTESVVALLDAQAGPIILVGHSMAGTVISQVAERRPERITTLVYLAAYLARNGESLYQLAGGDADSHLGPNLLPDQERGVLGVRSEAVRDVFFADCTEGDAARLAARIVPEPLAPLGTPVEVTDERFGRVPRIYITTTLDHAVSPALQRRMYTALPCRAVLSLDSGHAPFVSQPEALVAHLS
jgi:pimeloyl-ACP methyl ester carboxylesterase